MTFIINQIIKKNKKLYIYIYIYIYIHLINYKYFNNLNKMNIIHLHLYFCTQLKKSKLT